MGNSTSYTVNIKALFDAGDAQAKIKNIQTTLNNLKLPDNLRSSFNSAFNELNKSLDEFQTKSRQGIKNKADATAINKSFDKVIAGMEKYDQVVQKIRSQFGDQIDLNNWIKIDDSIKQKLEGIKKEIEDLQKQLNNVTPDGLKKIEQVMNKLKTEKSKGKIADALDVFKGATDVKDIQRAIDLVEKAKKSYAGLAAGDGKGSQTAENIIKQYQAIIDIMKEAEKEAQNVQQKIDFKQDEGLQVSTQAAQELNNQLNNCATTMSQVNQEAQNTSEPMKDLVTSAGQFGSELEQVKSRIQYFLGLANAINLVKRAIRSSFSTIKELDKAMTETAVVTNYTIKDMWKQLPDYTKRANQLGVTTKEAYESATLYYQQGLNTEQAAALSTETLKMARIAGLDAADATDRMTNALRGFNMELNTTQAQRVDDVYSQLAAMSASNVDEISTAMTKVASLAHNANMEFETTAAFLAQIIESTRESAETAGTALKTVVARFSEVKKLYNKEELKGQDEEGQVIDVNKVSAALRTAGIDLNKYFLGEVGLDDIFIELASKWDSLTNIQQRYIATQAAGSRQQSRFIALMADYARTQELVSAAYNSNGAAEKQFEKTQDSMQSKLARLKNAWDEFAMGLANNAVLKGAVDALTKLLQIVNKLTGALGSGAGSFLKWAVAIKTFGALKRSFGNGGFIDKAVTTVLKGSRIGQAIIKGGLTSGIDFNGDIVAGSAEAQARAEGKTTIIPRANLLSSLFNGDLKKKIQAFKEANANVITKTIDQGIDDTNGGNLTDTIDIPQETSLFSALGNKFQKTKLGTAISTKIGGLLGKGALGGAATLGVGLSAIAAAAATAFAAYKLWENFSPQGQLKQATKFADAMEQAADSAKKAKESTKKVYDTYTEKDKAVEEATSLTERNKAIEDRNSYINELLQQDSSYAKYLQTTFKDGKLELTLDEASIKKVMDDAAEAATKTAVGSDLAKAMQAGKQANVYRAEAVRAGADTTTGTIIDYDEDGRAYARKMTESEMTKYLGLDVQASERDAVMKAFAKSAYANMISGQGIGDELGNLVANALSSTFDADQYLSDIKRQQGGSWWNWTRSRDHWQEEYLKAYGTEASSDMKTADIARAVAQAGAQSEQQKNVTELSQLVKSNQNLYAPILKALNGEVEVKLTDNEDSILSNLISGFDNYTQEARLAALLQFDSVKDFEDAIRDSIKANKEVQKANIGNISSRTIKAGITKANFQKLIGLNPDQIAEIIGFADIAEKSLGTGVGKFFNNLPNYIDQGQLDNIQKFFGGFDLEQPLQAVKKINAAIADKTNPVIQEIASQVKDANQSIFDSGYLTQIFMTSDAYEDISENLEKFIKDNEEITADNINELAESCGDLKTLINETGVSAQSLARAFTAVGTGKVGIEGITSSVLEALGATKTTTTAIDSLFKSIDEFDTGRDFGKAVDFANEKIDTLRGSLETLDFGNETFKKNYQYFFKDYEKFVKLDTAGRKSLLTENLDRMEQLLDNDAVGAMRELAIKGIGVSQLDTEGFTFNWDVQGDWEDTVKQVEKELNVNTQMAETIVAAAAKHIPGLLDQMDVAGYQKTLHSFAEATKKDTVITTQELEALAAATGKELPELRKDLKDSGLNLPVEVNWQVDGKNLSGDELITQFKTKFSQIEKDFNKFKSIINKEDSLDEAIYGYDADQLLSYLQENYKLSSSQATEIANNIIQSVNGQFTKTVKIPVEVEKGQWEIQDVQVHASTVEGLEAEVQLKEQQAQWTQMGQAIATAIQEGIGKIDIQTNLLEPTNTQAIIAGIKVPSVGIPTYLESPSNTIGNHFNEFTGQYEAKGGIVSSYASGTRHIKPGVALTGEEGPELVWNKKGGYAYLVGKHGPEFADLVPGDQVFPADETKDIIRRGVTPSLAIGGKVVPSYDNGLPGSWNPNGGRNKKKDSGDGSGNNDDEFKMDLDKYYNMVEDINELLRLRNLLEKDYNQLLKTEGKTGKEIYDNLNRQLKLLEERSKIVADLAEKRKQQIIDEVAANQEYQKYAWWNNEDLTIEIDWDLVTSITDKDEGGKVKDYLSKLEDFQSKYDDMIEQLEEIEDTIQDIRERGKDQYNTLEERVRDALIKQIQDKIDELQDVDKAINDTNQKLFDSMQETLSMQRQKRDNAKTEEELTDKEKRLAYLQQDSSNANALEIAKLQEELADARQSYTDTLIDQKISELQKQNDQAQEQRQEQIELMQRSLDWQEKSGAFWETVYQYISEGTDAIGALVKQSELERLLMSAEPWDKLSEEQKLNWVNDLMDQVAQGIAYLELSRQLEDIGTKEGTSISFTNANGQTLTGKADKNGNVVVTNSDGSTITYKDVFQDYHGAYRTFETSGEAKAAPKPTATTKSISTTTTTTKSGGENKSPYLVSTSAWQYNESKHWKIQTYSDKSTKTINEDFHSWNYATKGWKTCSVCGYHERIINGGTPGGGGGGRVMLRYASGGLNTQAGPAWLDGTVSSPELVLNARDTENFIQLKDTLADMRKNGSLSLTGGDNYYDIKVQVDSLSSDYDVDRAIDRIKARIAQDGAYRNVNTLSRLR